MLYVDALTHFFPKNVRSALLKLEGAKGQWTGRRQ
jgi:hypothetical protein